MNVLERIVREVKDCSGAELRQETHLVDDLHFDSLDMMNLVLKIEQELEITIEDDDLDYEHFETVGALHGTLSRYVELH